MPRNGSGTYTLPAGNPVVGGTTVAITWGNTTMQDIRDALTASIAKDGQTTPSANLPMGGFKHTGVATGTARTHYAAIAQLQDGDTTLVGAVAGTNTITGNLTPAITAYTTGMCVVLIPVGNNTGAATLQLNGITGAKPIVKLDGDALLADNLVLGVPAYLVYDGVDFTVLNPQFSTFMQTLLDDTSASVARTTLGLTIGTNVQAFDPDLDAVAALGSVGIAVRSATATWVQRTLTGTTNRITVTNGNGVNGDPTVDISAAYVGQTTITTLGTIATGTWSGTAIAITDGGTGATTAAAARTNLVVPGTAATETITGQWTIQTPVTNAAEPGFRGTPFNTQNGNYTCVLTDAGKAIYKASGGTGETITIPANASVAYPTGTVLTFINQGAGALSIAITTDTMELAGTSSTGTRTLADNGVATAVKTAATTWLISGTGLT